jgi:hypothetical protein
MDDGVRPRLLPKNAVSGLCEPQKRKTKRGEQVRGLPDGTHFSHRIRYLCI